MKHGKQLYMGDLSIEIKPETTFAVKKKIDEEHK